jgi:eukaryotic-like serine/threonine-protein kinase
MKINPEMRGNLPKASLPQPWTSNDGRRRGWQLNIPGNRPLATPAVVGGRIFLGGGFGSYEFYAFDAATGNCLWQYQTEDDGPTAAVVYGEYVAFNTESCELEVLTVEGKRVWKEWLGDPLMSMPAIGDRGLFQIYPDSKGDRRHYLGAFELTTGRHLWKQPISGEIITAPVLADGCVYLTNLDGSMSCFRQADGEKIWHEDKKATSSPVVRDGECYFSQSEEVLNPRGADLRRTEGLSKRGKGAAGHTFAFRATFDAADYLDHKRRSGGSPYYAACELADGAVGFGHHKGDAKMEQARTHLGHGHVSSLWAYQGSKPFLYRGRLFSAVGDTLHSLDPHSENVYWKKQLYQRDGEVLDNVLTPPALVNGKLFVGTIRGEVCCLAAESGEELWRANLGEPVVFQPAVAGGRCYAGTTNGHLFCIETGDADDDGWLMWGGNAAHNGLQEATANVASV